MSANRENLTKMQSKTTTKVNIHFFQKTEDKSQKEHLWTHLIKNNLKSNIATMSTKRENLTKIQSKTFF